eukprot:403374741
MEDDQSVQYRAQLLSPSNSSPVQDYGAVREPTEPSEDGSQSQMGESVLFGDLQNQNNQERIHEMQKSLRQRIIAISTFLLFLFSVTLLVNKVGINYVDQLNSSTESDGLCGIEINMWFIGYTTIVAIKLLLTVGRYYFFRRDRKEHLAVFFTDLIVMNILMTAIFLKANIMYFSEKNLCWYTNDQITRSFYMIFCGLIFLGYLQFVWCILLSFFLPLTGFLIHQIVEQSLNRNNQNGDGNLFESNLLGGLMQVPLPIPEILSSLSRTKFNSNKFGQLQTQCAICWADFNKNEVVTPLLCDERHLYHTSCIESWIKKGHNTCPLCRKQIANIGGF